MTDANLRELERHFRASGSVRDEAAWLKARVQAGELEQSRLELAACCGHEAAQVALEDEVPEVRSGLKEFLADLGKWGKEPCVRAAIEAARLAIADRLRTTDKLPVLALESAEAWAIEQTSQATACAEEVADRCNEFLKEANRQGRPEEARLAMEAAVFAASAAANPAQETTGEPGDPNWGWAYDVELAVTLAANLVDEGKIVSTVSKTLGLWALGYSDPVRERVEARQQEIAGD